MFPGPILEPAQQPEKRDRKRDVEWALKKTWASYWSWEAFEERRSLGIDHLAGNMAEWLAADGDTSSLQCDCVGSGFKDRPTSKTTEDLASGKTVKSENRLIPRSDVGFRVILRPRASRELSWPQ